MDHINRSRDGRPSRRRFLGGAAALTAGFTFGSGWVGAALAEGEPLSGVAQRAVDGAVALLPGAARNTLSILIPGGSAGNITGAIEAWAKLTGMSVSLVEVPNTELYSKAMQEAVAQTGQYDLIIGPAFALPDFSEAGLAEDITDLVAKYDPEIDHGPDRIVAPFSEFGCKYADRYRGLYSDGDNWALYMRRDWLEDPEQQAAFKAKYGRDLAAPDTWAEYDELCAFFTQPEKGWFGSLEYRSPFYTKWHWMMRFCSKGGMYFDKDMNAQCNTPAGIEALKELIAMEPTLPKEAFSNGWSENYNQFAQGNVFSCLNWPSFFRYNSDATIAPATAGKLTVAPIPGSPMDGQVVRASVNAFGWLFVVNAHSPVKELAYLYAQFNTAPDVSAREIPKNGGYFDPFRENHFVNPGPELLKSYTREWLDVGYALLPSVIPELNIRGTFEYSDALDRNCVEAILGKMTAEDAMAAAAEEMDRITRRLGADKQIVAWRALARSFPEPIRKLNAVDTWG